MRRIRISEMAAEYIRSERAYLANYSRTAAAEFARKLANARSLLQRHAEMGKVKPGSNGVRLLVIPPYILEYEATDSAIEILIVRHGRQDEAAENRLPEDEDPMEG